MQPRRRVTLVSWMLAYRVTPLLLLAMPAQATDVPVGPAQTEAPATTNLEERLRALADRQAVQGRTTRDPAAIRAQIAHLEERRLSLLGKYTPTHPAVVQIERQLNRLRDELSQAEAAVVPRGPPVP